MKLAARRTHRRHARDRSRARQHATARAHVLRYGMRHAAVALVPAALLCASAVATAQPAEPPVITARYDKGVVLSTDDGAFQLKLALRNQFRFESTRPTEDGAEFNSRAYIPRARLQLEGHVFTVHRYKVEMSLGDRGNFGYLRDIYAERKLADAAVWLRVGQWKRPFNRQELVSDFGSAFNERANTAEFVGGGRDLGIALHNDYERSPDGLEWVVGVFNGFSGGGDRPTFATTCADDPVAMEIDCATTTPSTIPADFGPAIVARAGWNTGGIKGYSEVDLEGGPLRLAVGANYKLDLADLSAGGQDSVAHNLSHGLGADAMLKVEGFDLELGAYLMKLKAADARVGAMGQLGHTLAGRHAHLGARFAVAPSAGTREQLEARAAFTWFWQGHAAKLATDIGALWLTGTDPTTMTRDRVDLQLRTMAQLTF